MHKWTTTSFRITQEEKKQLKEFTRDYAKIHKIQDVYTLNQHLRHGIFTFMKSFYKKYPK